VIFLDLDERKCKILRAIVHAYIETGEPVGSKTLLNREDLNISSATVRNEMSELEQMGYLCKPHVSAGRIPSNEGYKFYVSTSLDGYILSNLDISILNPAFELCESIFDTVNETAKCIAQFSGCTVFAVSPAGSVGIFTFEVMPAGKKILAIMAIGSGNTVKSCFAKFESDITADDGVMLTKILNAVLSGFPVDQIGNVRIMMLENEIKTHCIHLIGSLSSIKKLIDQLKSYDLHISGATNLFSYPEFANIDVAREFMNMLNRQEQIVETLLENFHDNITIKIGEENKIFSSPNASVIAMTSNGKIPLVLGIMGPTRMDYARIIAGCKHIISHLNNNINNEF
jgi:heat-inducible transcriptional repressor